MLTQNPSSARGTRKEHSTIKYEVEERSREQAIVKVNAHNSHNGQGFGKALANRRRYHKDIVIEKEYQ
jgi:hypothetical protein